MVLGCSFYWFSADGNNGSKKEVNLKSNLSQSKSYNLIDNNKIGLSESIHGEKVK